MRVGTNERIGIDHAIIVLEDDSRKELKVHLMHNTVAGRHNREVLESLLTPLEEGESFLVADELELFVFVLSVGRARNVNLDRVIDDEVHLAQRVDLARISAHLLASSTHGSEVNNSGHTGEILKDDTGRLERNLYHLLGILLPIQDGLNVGLLDVEFIAVTHGTLEKNTDRERQFGVAVVAESRQVKVVERFAVHFELLLDVIEGISCFHCVTELADKKELLVLIKL